jgi:hypothetical protein
MVQLKRQWSVQKYLYVSFFNFLFDFLMWFEARNAKIIHKFIGVRLALRSAHAISY